MISSLSQFAGERKKTINYTSYLDKVVTISVRDVGKNTISALQEAVGAATYFCNQFGFVPVCKYCGNQMDLGFLLLVELWILCVHSALIKNKLKQAIWL